MKRLLYFLPLFIATGCLSIPANPGEFRFAGIPYRVSEQVSLSGEILYLIRSSSGKGIDLTGLPSDARHLSPCPPSFYFLHDMDGDGSPDFNFYSCGSLAIYPDTGKSLEKTEPLEGKRKEGNWLWMDESLLPGLKEAERLIRKRDPEG